jgi:hypothetical protein
VGGLKPPGDPLVRAMQDERPMIHNRAFAGTGCRELPAPPTMRR